MLDSTVEALEGVGELGRPSSSVTEMVVNGTGMARLAARSLLRALGGFSRRKMESSSGYCKEGR